MLLGKDPRDALVLTPRICGICSVSQSLAAASALADVQGIAAPPNGALMRNIILATENIADHLTHFYLFFMPDFARPAYAGETWHTSVKDRFRAVEGAAIREMLPARAAFMHIMGTLAGHWPHTLGLQPGGTTHAIDGAGKARVLATIAAFRRFLETRLFGDTLEAVTELKSGAELTTWMGKPGPASCDFVAFLRLAESLNLDQLGRATDRFMSFGAYEIDGKHTFSRGISSNGERSDLDPSAITEDLASGWFAHRDEARHPSRGVTVPNADAEGGYTWCKAPRYSCNVVEVGALARQVVDAHPLIIDRVRESGGNVANRVIARILEIARIVPLIEAWTRSIAPHEPFFRQTDTPSDGQGAGLIEAARGSLGHWITVKNGMIQTYQIVAPTTWNFSPRDIAGVPGACEQALVGAPVRDGETDPVSVQHIVRSFDPCMVCTVH